MSPTSQSAGIGVLRTLHRIHRQLTDLRERLDRGPKKIRAADAGAVHRQQQLGQVKSDLEHARMKADRKQLDLKSGEEKIKELRIKLNGAASNEEYRILTESIAAKEMANSVLADEVLEALEEIDQYPPRVQEAESNLAAARQQAVAVREQFAAEEPLIRADLQRLETELAESETALPADILEVYRRAVRQKGQDALAAVDGEYCSGCQQHVPLNVCNKVTMGEPLTCRACGRLLYMPEDRAPSRPSGDEE